MSTPAPTEFKAVLDQTDLADIPRDLSFHPVQNTSPRVLTSAQIEQFNRDGYIAGIRIYSDDEIKSIRSYFDNLLAKVVAAGGDSYSISSAHLKAPSAKGIGRLPTTDILYSGLYWVCARATKGRAKPAASVPRRVARMVIGVLPKGFFCCIRCDDATAKARGKSQRGTPDPAGSLNSVPTPRHALPPLARPGRPGAAG